jgi:hypothetical protein
MGAMRNSEIDAFQRKAGIEPATGAQLAALNDMQQKAFELIRVIELERCGIRDGDGSWSGSDAFGGTVEQLMQAYRSYAEPAAPVAS